MVQGTVGMGGGGVSERIITTQDELYKAARDLPSLVSRLPFRLSVSPVKERSTVANSHYWVNLGFWLGEVQTAINETANRLGLSPSDAKLLLANNMPTLHALIMYARERKVAHSVLKDICNIPTSTKLGTKAFHKFDETMERTMAEILGEVRAA